MLITRVCIYIRMSLFDVIWILHEVFILREGVFFPLIPRMSKQCHKVSGCQSHQGITSNLVFRTESNPHFFKKIIPLLYLAIWTNNFFGLMKLQWIKFVRIQFPPSFSWLAGIIGPVSVCVAGLTQQHGYLHRDYDVKSKQKLKYMHLKIESVCSEWWHKWMP